MRTFAILVFFLLLSFINVNAQESDTLRKPKIGLVLSGGAAKGIAHIGVLKVLEEAGIMPDYIAGTSMGAVVGALYALGYTADEIAELNANADWNNLLSDRIPLNEVVFEEKYEYRKYIIGFPIRNYHFRLPSGVIEGQQLEKFFTGLMWPLAKLESFDSLSVPFHCMAVDLISGKLVELKSGNLAESVRASMSIPSIFTPESIDTMLFVDGGVIRNFPVEEVRKMGADIVIGVYVGFEEKVTKEDLFSLSDVLSRATVFYGIYDSGVQMKLVDVLIQPDLQDLGATDFSKSKKIEELGEVAALEMQERLYKLADSLQLKYKPIKRIQQPEKILISDIDVINTRFVEKDFVIGRSDILKGTYITKAELSEAVDKIFGTQYFKKVTYNLEIQDDGSYKLIFNVKESTRAFLNVAAHYDNKYGPGIVTNLTLRNYLAPASRATLSLNIAESPGVRLDINKYIGKKQKMMDNFFLNWQQNTNYLYQEGTDVGTYRHSIFEAGMGGKYSFATNHQIGLLGYYELNKIVPHENLKTTYSEVNFENYGFGGFAYRCYYDMNTTDDKYFPHKGMRLNLSYKHNYKPNVRYQVNENTELIDQELFKLNLEAFNSFYFNFDQYIGFYDKFILNIGLSAGLTSDEAVVISNYAIGGYHYDPRINYQPFAGLNYSEYVEPNYGLVKAGFDFEIISRVYISACANIGFFTDKTGDYLPFIKTSPLNSYVKGYCAGLRVDTILGPLTIMVGDNNLDKNVRWYVSFGYPF